MLDKWKRDWIIGNGLKIRSHDWVHGTMSSENLHSWRGTLFPNLGPWVCGRRLYVFFQLGNSDMKIMTWIADQLETLELITMPNKSHKPGNNFDWIPLNLKKLVFLTSPYRKNNGSVLKKFISIRESLIIQYDKLIDVEVAESLGVWWENDELPNWFLLYY